MLIGLSDVRSWWVDLLRSMRDHFISNTVLPTLSLSITSARKLARVDLRRVWLMLREKFLDRFGIVRSATGGIVGLESLGAFVPHLDDVALDGRYRLGIAEQQRQYEPRPAAAQRADQLSVSPAMIFSSAREASVSTRCMNRFSKVLGNLQRADAMIAPPLSEIASPSPKCM